MNNEENTKRLTLLQSQNNKLLNENKFLLTQLLAVQEELERYYHKLANVEGGLSADSSSTKGLNLKCENERLNDLLSLHKSLRMCEMENSLHARFGRAILKLKKFSFTSPFKFFSLLAFFSKTSPPKELGGKDFSEVIKAYENGNKKAVEELLEKCNINSIIKANAYTALAKHVLYKDIAMCTYYAQEAYMTDPCSYRLKWWIMRLDDMNDTNKAKALVELLPLDTAMNEKEKSRIQHIRQAHR